MTLARLIPQQEVRQGVPRVALPSSMAIEPVVTIDEAAIERGFAQGLLAGQEAAEVACAARLAELDAEHQSARDADRAVLEATQLRYDAAISRLSREVEDDRLWAEGIAVEIAFAAVTRWLGNHRLDLTVLETLCADAMRGNARAEYILRACPADADRLSQMPLAVSVVADAALGEGDLLLDSDRGSFDASLESRLNGLRDALLSAVREGAAHG